MRVFHSDARLHISLFHAVVIVDIAGSIAGLHMKKIEEAVLLLRNEHGGDIGILAIIQQAAPIPGAEARNYAVHMVKAHGQWLTLIATVIEDSSVVMQLFASLIRSINFLAGKARINAFPQLAAAEEALVAQLMPGPSSGATLRELRAAVEAARAHFAKSRASSAA